MRIYVVKSQLGGAVMSKHKANVLVMPIRVKDEADVLFGDDNKRYPLGNIGFPDAEAEFIFDMLAAGWSLEQKLAMQKQFRAADNDGKWALFETHFGPKKDCARANLGL